MMRRLESYVAGRWYAAKDEGRPLLEASTGEELARFSAQGLDLGEVTACTRNGRGLGLRVLTFNERATQLKELGFISCVGSPADALVTVDGHWAREHRL